MTSNFLIAQVTVLLAIVPGEQTNPVRLNVELVKRLQFNIAPGIFTPRAVYDGRKNLYASHELRFANKASSQEVSIGGITDPALPNKVLRQFGVTLSDAGGDGSGKAPKEYKIRLAKVAEINPESVPFDSVGAYIDATPF
jgi:eukaryotic translation initiation factor 2C